MPGAHARLAPSSAERWIACPASIRMAEKAEALSAESPESPYAAEGTTAHELAEIEGSYAFGRTTERERLAAQLDWGVRHSDLDDDTVTEMNGHVADFVQFVKERAALYPMSQVLFEQRMPSGIPNCWGTSDVVIVSPNHVEIIDLKYGAGIAVDALNNPQLRLYALGALDTFGDMLGETERVLMTVFQPRMYPSKSTEELTADELRAWRTDVALPAGRSALTDDDAPFGPSPKACRFCPAAGICQARVETLAELDFGEDPEVLSAAETAEWLKQIPEIKAWCTAVETAALNRAYSGGEELPGFKVVLSGGKRTITDAEAAVERLVKAGFRRDEVQRVSPQTLGHLEKLVGKKQLPELLGDLLVKPPGRPALVSDEDDRPAIDPTSEAAKDFS